VEDARQFAGQLGHPGFEFLAQPEDALGVGHDHVASRGERHATVAPVEQAGVELFFQLLDLEGHGRLGHEQRLSGTGEGSVPGNGVKNLEAAISHRS
jgi:hypothetical protein